MLDPIRVDDGIETLVRLPSGQITQFDVVDFGTTDDRLLLCDGETASAVPAVVARLVFTASQSTSLVWRLSVS